MFTGSQEAFKMLDIMRFLLLVTLASSVTSLPDAINIGGIFDPHDLRQEVAFRSAVNQVNKDADVLGQYKLVAFVESLPADDSFHASRRVCELLRDGMAGIFGPQSENTANHVQSISDAMEVPHIETRWNYKLNRDEYSVNLYPHPTSLSQAYYDVIKKLDWKSFVVLYDSGESLIRLQPLLKAEEFGVTVKQLEGEHDWRPMLKSIKKSQETKFIIDVEHHKIHELLRQAQQIGLTREYHSYFITTLDLHLVNLDDFMYSGTNITSLRLVDPRNPDIVKFVESWHYEQLKFGLTLPPELATITTESALIFDAVHLYARALDYVLKDFNDIAVVPLHCETDQTWSHGSTILNYIKSLGQPRRMNRVQDGTRYAPDLAAHKYLSRVNGQPLRPVFPGPYEPNMATVNFGQNIISPTNISMGSLYPQFQQVYGLTGLIKFDGMGFRTEIQLDIMELEGRDGLMKVGTWTLDGGANYTRNYATSRDVVSENLRNRTLIVTTALTPPYSMLTETPFTLEGNARYEGFCIDIIDDISKILGFNYTIQEVGDGAYGSINKETGEWNGMIRELLEHKADLGIVDFTITYEREEAVDFSMPFMNLGISIIYKKPTKKAPSLFSFMSPFSLDVWIYMATAYLGVSVLMFFLARISPEEWATGTPCMDEACAEELENCFSLNNSLWFMIATFLCQGADIAPRAISTRIVAGIWWFFTLIMISSYTANLAAFLTVERMDAPIESAEDLAKQTKIKYGCKYGGSTYSFFQESKIDTYARMWTAMNNARPTVFTSSNEEGVDRVSKSTDGGYAFMMESSSIDYEIERKCDLMQVGGLLDSKSYGIALPPGSPYTGAISSAILKLKEQGRLHELKKKWWKEKKSTPDCDDESDGGDTGGPALGLANVGGVFVVMVGGCGVAALVAAMEFMWKARKHATTERMNFVEEVMKDINFALSFNETEKPIRKDAQSTEEDGNNTEKESVYT